MVWELSQSLLAGLGVGVLYVIVLKQGCVSSLSFISAFSTLSHGRVRRTTAGSIFEINEEWLREMWVQNGVTIVLVMAALLSHVVASLLLPRGRPAELEPTAEPAPAEEETKKEDTSSDEAAARGNDKQETGLESEGQTRLENDGAAEEANRPVEAKADRELTPESAKTGDDQTRVEAAEPNVTPIKKRARKAGKKKKGQGQGSGSAAETEAAALPSSPGLIYKAPRETETDQGKEDEAGCPSSPGMIYRR